MRLIDADALKEELGIAEDCDDCERLGAHGCVNSTWAIVCDRIDDQIESAPTIDAVPRWIPCEERLPEKDGYYLVTHQWQIFKDEYEINIDEYRHGEWVETPRSCMTVAWMPLPEPYGAEREDDE